MIITLSPYRAILGHRLTLATQGDVLTIGDETFDFTALPEGAVLPVGAVDAPHLLSDVTRAGGHVCLTLSFPIGPQAPPEARFPTPVIITADGPVTLPDDGLAPQPAPEEEDAA